MNGATRHLLALSLGPVQGFIAAARKTRDLWFGSWLLSEVARHAAQALQDAGADLIFPAPDSLIGTAESVAIPVANHIVAILPPGSDPEKLAAVAHQAAQDVINGHQQRTLERITERRLIDTLDHPLFDRQIGALLEFYAAWYPYDPASPASYTVAREAVDSLLEGRKTLRDFAPAPVADAARKCVPMSALDGGRASVLRTKRVDDLNRLGIKRGEALDGVSLLKRLAAQRRFPSLSRLALDPLLRGWADHPRVAAARRLAATLIDTPLVEPLRSTDGFDHYAAFPYDSDLFFEGMVTDDDLADLSPAQATNAYALQQAARELYHAVPGLGDPPAYVAILVADGDRIGAAISAMRSADAHRAFSDAGVRFAHEAGQVVVHHHGTLIYSGGDDVLALLPLDTVVDCADALHTLFARTMQPPVVSEKLTLSVGVAIGHHLENLQSLLQWGRNAEQVAKRTRNSLAVALHTRSAGPDAVIAVDRWDEADPPLARWRNWIRWFNDETLPGGLAYELRTLARELRDLEHNGQLSEAFPLVAECERILRRKRGGRGTVELAREVHRAITRFLNQPAPLPLGQPQPAPPYPLRQRDRLANLDRLVNELLIARHCADAVRLARGAPTTVTPKEGTL